MKHSVNKGEYTEAVNGAEKVGSSGRILRIVSSVAAGAVLAAGIGASGFMLRNDKTTASAQNENCIILTENEVKTCLAQKTYASGSPFVDFGQIYFTVYNLNESFAEYSSKTYDVLAEYLNNYKWGNASSIEKAAIPDFNGYEGKGYEISWRKGGMFYNIYVTESGKAYYLTEQQFRDGGGTFEYSVIESSVYDIDYKTFDKDIQDILAHDVPDADKYLSPRELKRLNAGEFERAVLHEQLEDHYKPVCPEVGASTEAFQNFLKDDFVAMLQKRSTLKYDQDKLKYTVYRYFKTSDTTTREEYYTVCTDGVVGICLYEIVGGDKIPSGMLEYYIDIEAFETKLHEVLTAKKNADETVTTQTTTTTASPVTTTTSAVTEKTLGDMDGNGILDAVDASKMLAVYAKYSTGAAAPTEEDTAVADVNKDGYIDAVDAAKVLAYYAHTSTGGKLTIEEFLKSAGKQDNKSDPKTSLSDEELFRAFYAARHDGSYGSIDGSYIAMDENGNMVDFKDEATCLIYRAGILPVDRVLGSIANEEEAIAKGRELLRALNGDEYIEKHERDYIERNGVKEKIYKDNPDYRATYYDEYDIWDFRPTLLSGKTESGVTIATPGSVPHFYIRGSDGKILAAFH